MRYCSRPVCCLAGLIAILSAGCSDPSGPEGRAGGASERRRATDAASRRVAGVTLAQLTPVAEQAFLNSFRIDRDASTATRLVAIPADAPDLEQRGQSGDVLSITPRRKRRLAELRLLPETDAVVVQVRVLTQRLSTTERAAFAFVRGDDRPTGTAIDRQGPTSSENREEWVDWRRDRKLEEEILREIQAAFTQTQPADGGQVPAGG